MILDIKFAHWKLQKIDIIKKLKCFKIPPFRVLLYMVIYIHLNTYNAYKHTHTVIFSFTKQYIVEDFL